MNSSDADCSVTALRAECPELCSAVDELASQWLQPAIERLAELDKTGDANLRSKQINDPIWQTFEIEDHEVLFIDSPLLQRMRGVRQLGLANLVFPAANHDRFEHICGVIEAAERMFLALKANASRRREKDKAAGKEPPTINEFERTVVRLAAIFHDIGHGPFSHAIEPVMANRYQKDLKAFNSYITKVLYLDSKVEIAELISILIVLSPTVEKILQHALFKRPTTCPANELQLRIATLIMGARRHGHLACWSAIISGQVDADKLDYMPRDAHHSGMPIAFDTERLLRKLEIVRCTSENLPASQTKNREYADSSPGGQYFDIGIAASGVGALEQMLIGRAFLYDRLYHHHKVRSADAMAQRLMHFAAIERGKDFDLRDLYIRVNDDTMIRLLGGSLKLDGFETGGVKAAYLARAILERDLYVRAFAFRASFHAGLPATENEKEKTDALADIWSPVSTDLSDLKGRLDAEEKLFDLAKNISTHINDSVIVDLGRRIRREHIIVDLAGNRVKPITINVHAEDGSLEEPNLFFDPARWSQVYDLQKRTGYVFCPREFVPLISLAAKIYFFERWGYAISDKADRFTKTLDSIKSGWVGDLKKAGRLDELSEEVLFRKTTVRTYLRKGDVKFPSTWENESPDFEQSLFDQLRVLIPQGISIDDKKAVIGVLSGLSAFMNALHLDKNWVTRKEISEKELQQELARFLRAKGLEIEEGGKIGGGEYDLLAEDRTIIENKVLSKAEPFSALPSAPYQANRYAIAKCQRIFFMVVGYRPKDESELIEQTKSIKIQKLENIDRTAIVISIAVPYGLSRPSEIKLSKK